MNTNLETAIRMLAQGAYTCVLCKDGQVYTSCRRGVAPLMGFWEQKTDLKGFSAADKVVGKATALLYCLLGVSQVYATVLSRPAAEVLASHGIDYRYETLVDAILNRTGDGFCPMETATKQIHDPAQAPAAIQAALQALAR